MIFVGVCGGRKFSSYDVVATALARMVKRAGARVVIVHGDAPGADQLADRAARKLRLDVIRVPALWTEYGRGAGPRRNGVIAALPLKYLLAFPGGDGTADMSRRAAAAGVEVVPASELGP